MEVLGALAAVIGASLALAQRDIKMMFAYGGISHIGIILIGIGQGNQTGFAGGVFYLLKGTFNLKQSLENEKELSSKLLEESKMWKEKSKKYLEGLSNSIDEQLTIWELTKSEKEVAFLLLKGFSFKEVEELLMSGAGILGFVLFLCFAYLLSRYKRCPSNRILVIYGKVGSGKSAKCIHGGGTFVLPIIQDWKFMSLNPMPIEINLQGALSKQNIRINTPSTFTVAISTDNAIMLNAAERLLGLEEPEIKEQALDIIIGQLRLVIATLTIEEINQDREQFLHLINKHVATELNKIGLHLINVNIKDITDESGYIESIGKKAASEALNQAKVEVAQQERMGAIGHAKAVRQRDVEVANEEAQSEEGVKDANTRRRVAVANLEVKAVAGEAIAEKERQIQIAAQEAESEEGVKDANARKRVAVAKLEASAIEGENTADAQQRIAVAKLEAKAIEGENESKAKVADYEAGLAEKRAEANRRSQVAEAEAETAILQAEKLVELSLLEKNG